MFSLAHHHSHVPSSQMIMELVFLLLILPALLSKPTDYDQQETMTLTTRQNVPITTDNTSRPPSHSYESRTVTPIVQIQHKLGTVRVHWQKPCQGRMMLSWNFTEEEPKPLSFRDTITKPKLDGKTCKERGCGEFLKMFRSTEEDCYIVHENLTVTPGKCNPEVIICKDRSHEKDSKELVVYKTITGLLLALILAVILLRYTRPVYEAFHKRFSKKRQNRWIGPTQSQSVSYHRGQQAGNPGENTVKRQSFPGLERLTVNSSREPSSNRNSDYDSYGFN